MTAQKWVRSSLRTLSAKLEAAGHAISPPTVGRLLRKLDYSLHVNAKKLEASSNHPDRGRQFDYIAPLAVGSTSTPSSINLLASHFHAVAGGLSPPLPRRL